MRAKKSPAYMSAALRPGMLVHQDVRLLRPLSVGGMGSIWAAEHRKLLTEVAVKVIAADLADDPVARARFEQEATRASRVRSPHVVQILDFGVSPHGDPFIVMELLEGRDLRTHLQQVGKLPRTDALSVCKQLCHALAKAHTAGIVHRDLKPSNVFLCDSPQEMLVKLLDFGIAKETRIDGALSTTGAVGTPFYMSPEQLTGEQPVDHRTDIWALGVLVFEMLTGRRPFEGATTGALALAIHTMPLPSACAHGASLPAAVDEWFSRACARSPSGRFNSAGDAARALEFALALPGAAASSVSLPSTGTPTRTDPHPAVAPRPGSGQMTRGSRRFAVAAVAALFVTSALFTINRSSHGAAAEPVPTQGLVERDSLLPEPRPAPATQTGAESAGAATGDARADFHAAALVSGVSARRSRGPLVVRPAASVSAPSAVPSASVAEAPSPLTIPVERK